MAMVVVDESSLQADSIDLY